jgi:hypothetical protein
MNQSSGGVSDTAVSDELKVLQGSDNPSNLESDISGATHRYTGGETATGEESAFGSFAAKPQ